MTQMVAGVDELQLNRHTNDFNRFVSLNGIDLITLVAVLLACTCVIICMVALGF